jgi:methylenetetrahydrofolate reductase (NADPH)
MRLRHRRTLSSHERSAVARLLADPLLELIPLQGVARQIDHLPAGGLISITASPAAGTPATLELAEELQRRGHRTVPHLSARMIRDRAELEGILGRIADLGITRVFVIGGDADPTGEFTDALGLLEAMEEIGHPFTEIGVGCYPDGHAVIPDDVLLRALRNKSRIATSMTSQVCFAPRTIVDWLVARRREGIKLPIRIGIPGATHLAKLMRISARIGVGRSLRFITKNTSLAGRLGRPGGYAPDALVGDLAEVIVDPVCGVDGFHVFTFNQVEETEAWRASFLEYLNG